MNTGLLGNFRTLARGPLVGTAVYIGVFQIFGWLGLRLNVSPSLPVGLYITSGDGKLLEFCPVEPFANMAIARGYRTRGSCPDGGAPLLKPVVATTGDLVYASPGGIEVNGVRVPNTAPQAEDTKGRPLAHWPFGRYIVATGMVWVASSYNRRSFDSRYFGPVPATAVRYHLRPVLCF